MKYHASPVAKIMKELGSSESGLSTSDSEKKLETYGLNELKKTQSFKALKAFLEQFKSSLVIILIIASVVSYFIAVHEGESPVDAIVIGIIVLVNAVLGFIQEFKAEKSLEHLRNMLVPTSQVVRDGEIIEIPSKQLVPGDILIINEGDTVSADARLIEATRLQIDEAALTGESLPRQKNTDQHPEKTALADRNNMIYQGTNVVGGSARAIVVDTGMSTELGKISTMVQEIVEDKNPFQQKLDSFARKVGVVILVLCAIVVGGLLVGGAEIMHSFMVAVSLAVSAIPEGLPAVISLGFALATKRLVKKNVIVRKLPSSETLGRVTTICTDKTGTLTKSKMEVVESYTADEHAQKKMFLATALNHSVTTVKDDESSHLSGDPTEIALVSNAIAHDYQPEKLLGQYKKLDEIPFSSERKMMTTIHNNDGEKIAFTKGAPEKIFARVTHELVDNKKKKLNKKRIDEIHDRYEEMAGQGLRVLAYAMKTLPQTDTKISDEQIESDLTFLGMQAMQDPARPEVAGSIQACQDAGIRVVMVTGDGKLTAAAIAKQIGIQGDAMNASEMTSMSDKQVLKKLETTGVFSRIEPADKLRIVDLLKSQGEIVAMTGDGVNDALALKRSDIGIAMGIRGTEVSKGASDMVLIDDNFSSIVGGIREGRKMFANIKKFVTYLLAANFYEVALVFLVTVIFRDPELIPFLALQILWINLVTDSLPALALSTQPAEDHIMKQKPTQKNLLSGTKGFLLAAGLVGFTLLAITLYKYYQNMEVARTMVVTVSVFYQMLLAINCASWGPVWKFWGNRTLWGAILVSLGLHIGLIYSPLGAFFYFVSIGWSEWIFIIIMGVIGFVAIEVLKPLVRKNEEKE